MYINSHENMHIYILEVYNCIYIYTYVNTGMYMYEVISIACANKHTHMYMYGSLLTYPVALPNFLSRTGGFSTGRKVSAS